jgi:DNA-binding LacI/PurR family transcriptional regulator
MQNIAVFAPLTIRGNAASPYFSSILAGISEAAFDSDFSISLIPTNRIPRNENDFQKFCQNKKIDAAIFVLLSLEDHFVTKFANKIPLVTVSRPYENSPIGFVAADNYSGGYSAVKHLIDYGHNNMLFIAPDLNYHDHVERIRGAEKALNDYGLKQHPKSICSSLSLSETDLGYQLKSIMEDPMRPTAMFVASDQEAIKVMNILQGFGVAVPDDVSLVGFGNLYFSSLTSPALTTIQNPTYEIGREACHMAIRMLNNEIMEIELKKILENTSLIIRKSTKRIT